MKQKDNPIQLLLKWAGNDKYWMYLSIILSLISGICIMIPYYSIYQLMDAIFTHTCTNEFVLKNCMIVIIGLIIRFAFLVHQVSLRIKEHIELCLKSAV